MNEADSGRAHWGADVAVGGHEYRTVGIFQHPVSL